MHERCAIAQLWYIHDALTRSRARRLVRWELTTVSAMARFSSLGIFACCGKQPQCSLRRISSVSA